MNITIDNKTIEIRDSVDLFNTALSYRKHADLAIQQLLQNPEMFSQIIDTWGGFYNITRLYSNQTDELVLYVLKNPVVFKQIIKESNDICNFANSFSDHADALLQNLLQNPEEFKRLIKDSRDLSNLIVNYPDQVILQKDSVDEVLQEIIKQKKSYTEIKKNACVLAEESKSLTSFFSILPNPLRTRIVVLTRDPSAHNVEEAQKIAADNFPPPNYAK